MPTSIQKRLEEAQYQAEQERQRANQTQERTRRTTFERAPRVMLQSIGIRHRSNGHDIEYARIY